MTKSEARAISEGAARALRMLGGTSDQGLDQLDQDLRKEVFEVLKPAIDEVTRILQMADAELDKR